MRKTNIKELAKILNISVATVSKALRDSHEISELTKKKVLEAARDFNYTPNPYASSLRRKKSKTIAVILPEVADNFFSLAINGIQSVAESKGYHVLIYLSHESFEIEKTVVEDCRSGRIDGLLISITSETESANHIQKLLDEKIPVVFFDREAEQIVAPKVLTNDYECGYLSAKLLLKKGCRHIKFLSISSSLPICTKRAQGFLDAMKDAGIEGNEENLIFYCTGAPAKTQEQIRSFLLNRQSTDGIVASVERLAIQVYLSCHELGIKIPDDIKIIAFSTVETAPILNPSLSTITQPAFEIGKNAADILFTLMNGKDYGYSKKPMIIPSLLIERDSTKSN
jgi:LacI family transcriptional regulator